MAEAFSTASAHCEIRRSRNRSGANPPSCRAERSWKVETRGISAWGGSLTSGPWNRSIDRERERGRWRPMRVFRNRRSLPTRDRDRHGLQRDTYQNVQLLRIRPDPCLNRNVAGDFVGKGFERQHRKNKGDQIRVQPACVESNHHEFLYGMDSLCSITLPVAIVPSLPDEPSVLLARVMRPAAP